MSVVTVIADVPVVSQNYECSECGLKLGIVLLDPTEINTLRCPEDNTEMLLRSSEKGSAWFSNEARQHLDDGAYLYAWE